MKDLNILFIINIYPISPTQDVLMGFLIELIIFISPGLYIKLFKTYDQEEKKRIEDRDETLKKLMFELHEELRKDMKELKQDLKRYIDKKFDELKDPDIQTPGSLLTPRMYSEFDLCIISYKKAIKIFIFLSGGRGGGLLAIHDLIAIFVNDILKFLISPLYF